jgi:manganese transport protein
MGQYVVNRWMQAAGWVVALVIAVLNLKLVYDGLADWLTGSERYAWLIGLITLPVVLGLVWLLGYVIVKPFLERWRNEPVGALVGVHGPTAIPEIVPPRSPRLIAAALDFSWADKVVVSYAVTLARAAGRGAKVLLFHVVESGGALVMGGESRDREAEADQERLKLYAAELTELGVDAEYDLGFGDPPEELAKLVEQHKPDLIVLGSHGHRRMGDIVHGTSVERLRHRVKVPVMVIPAGAE